MILAAQAPLILVVYAVMATDLVILDIVIVAEIPTAYRAMMTIVYVLYAKLDIILHRVEVVYHNALLAMGYQVLIALNALIQIVRYAVVITCRAHHVLVDIF